ncbi:DMT family transporter [Kamptonema sp. UHCC 0994]|uniref:DMT family transporter n=1 Tax=Kamptonema sp. UHCC 0994 TaxID=3031329 RepID=UPI0023B9ED03|nr:DMT family transporter [Kamptonema sp. UHCC 0994]MDF0551645.1 DMT family transporter [Kamptonema sp. UHCC 0994]
MTDQLKLPDQYLSEPELSQTSKLMAIVALLIANIGIAFAPIFIVLSEKELSPTATIFNRLWIGAVVLGLWKIIQIIASKFSDKPIEEPKAYDKKDVVLLLVVGIAFPLGQITWAWSLIQTSAAISALLHDLSPLFTSLAVWLLFGQRFDSKFIIGMFIAIGGGIAIGLQDAQIATSQLEGDAAALLSAVFYGTYLIGLEQLRSKFSNTNSILLISAISSLLPLIFAIFAGDRLVPYSLSGWLSVIALAVVCQVIGQGLTSYSIKRLSSGFVALFSLLIPVLTAFLAEIFFEQTLNFSTWLAFGVVLFGLYLGISSKSAVKSEALD